ATCTRSRDTCTCTKKTSQPAPTTEYTASRQRAREIVTRAPARKNLQAQRQRLFRIHRLYFSDFIFPTLLFGKFQVLTTQQFPDLYRVVPCTCVRVDQTHLSPLYSHGQCL